MPHDEQILATLQQLLEVQRQSFAKWQQEAAESKEWQRELTASQQQAVAQQQEAQRQSLANQQVAIQRQNAAIRLYKFVLLFGLIVLIPALSYLIYTFATVPK